jgi:aryl-alcohol dehydrogenase-like predicted oxidoreductase
MALTLINDTTNTDIKVSKICLGTMTLVNKIQTEGHAQMDYALENGVNFF